MLGIIWTAITALVMFALAFGKAKTGSALGNPVLQTEWRITMIDGILATAVLHRLGPQRSSAIVVGRSTRRRRLGLLRHSRVARIAGQAMTTPLPAHSEAAAHTVSSTKKAPAVTTVIVPSQRDTLSLAGMSSRARRLARTRLRSG